MEKETFCPSTMCPLFASEGSPWTRQYDVPCEKDKCAFFFNGKCDGSGHAEYQIEEVLEGKIPLQIGNIHMKHKSVKKREFDCPNSKRCQWQKESGDKLCPPRMALSKGIDPRVCVY